MKYLTAILLYLCLNVTLYAQNDCPEALVICGDGDYIGLAAMGPGVQELIGTNDCSSAENHSVWLELTIKTGGTLGFDLIPTSNELVVDFDFFIYGPNVQCGNIGHAVRCSTTNPLMAGSDSNITGMNDTETDIAEGPGPHGNNYIYWMTVQAGEKYFLVVDRPVGASDFSLHWTGTARFHPIPVFNNPGNISIDLTECDVPGDDNGISTFNLAKHAAMLVGSQENVVLTYHENLNDVTTGENPLNTSNYRNTSNPQTIYMRMTNTITGCYSIESFDITILWAPVYNDLPPGSAHDLEKCDTDATDDGINITDLTQNEAVYIGTQNASMTYYLNEQDAHSGNNKITDPANYVNISSPQRIFTRLQDNSTGCTNINSFNIWVHNLPQFVNPQNIDINLYECDDDGTEDGFTLFNLTRHAAMLTGGQNNLQISYYESLSGANTGNNAIALPEEYTNISNPQTIYMRMLNTDTGCTSTSSFTINVHALPVYNNPLNINLDLEECDMDGTADDSYIFDLTQHAALLTNSQPNRLITYYLTQNDANTANNAVNTPDTFRNTVNPQTIYMRLTDTQTGCFRTMPFIVTVNALPVFNNPQNITLKIEECDRDNVDDKSYLFNIKTYEPMFRHNQPNITFSYHIDITDADSGNNPVLNPQAFRNTVNPQTVYVRMLNTVTGCYSIHNFQVEVVELLDAGVPDDLYQCDFDNNGFQTFNLNQNTLNLQNGDFNTFVRYYRSESDAINRINPLPFNYRNRVAYASETIWGRLQNISGCIGYDIKPFTINIYEIPDIRFSIDIVDFTVRDNSITIVMPDADDYEFSLDGNNYQESPVFDGLLPGLYKIYIRAKTHCKTVEKQVTILNYPKFFTPNGDGFNEYWQVDYLYLQPRARVSIFDRYGKLLSVFGGTSQGWDGVYNNRRLPATDYWFVLELEDGRVIKGHFAMIR